MAAKIVLAALAVVCCSAVATANPVTFLSSDDVLSSLKRVLNVVETQSTRGESLLTAAIDKIRADALTSNQQLGDYWLNQVSDLVGESPSAEAQACGQKQRQSLEAVIEELRDEAVKCVDSQMEAASADLRDLQAMKPKADDILAEADEEVAKCGQQSLLGQAICLARIMGTKHVQAGTLATKSLVQFGKLSGDLALSTFKTNTCIAKRAAKSIEDATDAISQVSECIGDVSVNEEAESAESPARVARSPQEQETSDEEPQMEAPGEEVSGETETNDEYETEYDDETEGEEE